MKYNNFDNVINAGRMINEISLDDILTQYKRNIFDLISLCKFKTVVFDFDGTLTSFKYDKEKLLPCLDDDLQEYCKNNTIYSNVRLLNTMKYIINELEPKDIFILSVTVESLRKNKEEVILSSFNIQKDHIYQVDSTNDKIKVLKELHEKNKKDIIFIEDTAKTLLIAEETFDFIKGYHISSLIS